MFLPHSRWHKAVIGGSNLFPIFLHPFLIDIREEIGGCVQKAGKSAFLKQTPDKWGVIDEQCVSTSAFV